MGQGLVLDRVITALIIKVHNTVVAILIESDVKGGLPITSNKASFSLESIGNSPAGKFAWLVNGVIRLVLCKRSNTYHQEGK